MKPRISMITLGVKDFDRSVKFYSEGLGLPLREEPEGIAFFKLNGSWLSLYDYEALAEDAMVSPERSGFNGITLAHNVSSEAEVDEIIQQAINSGAELAKQPQKVFWGGYSGYFKDPDGYLWEVAYNPFSWIGPVDKE